MEPQTTPQETEALELAPPIWWAFKDSAPSRPISYAIVHMGGRRVGRIDRPEVMAIDEAFLLERFPALYAPGAHEIRLDFRAQRGRGALGHVSVTFGDPSADAGPPISAATPEVALVEWAQRVMVQNERLAKMVIDQVQTNSTNAIDNHEKMLSMMIASSERNRQQHSDWLEREAQLRASQYETSRSRGADSADAQGKLLEMILPLLASGGGGQSAQFMETIQTAVAEKLLGNVLGKIENMDAGEGADPMTQMIGTIGPMIMSKLGGAPDASGDAPPATGG